MRLLGYVRVSRVGGREGDSFISPDVQREKIEGYANLHGHTVVDVLVDLDASGGRDDRPRFQEALAAVEAGEADGIIVAHLSRFARSMGDAAHAIRRIAAAGGELVSVDDRWDTTTPMGKFGLHLTLALAELELDRVRESWDVAKSRAIGRGVHFASRGVFGYRRERGRPLEPDPETAPLVVAAFEARAGGSSYTEIASMLDERTGEGPNGSPRWTPQAAKRMLGNRAYVGEARWGEHFRRDAHDPLVSESVFRAAQNGRMASPMRFPAEGALLHGLLRCAGCRHALNRTTPRVRSDGTPAREYRCRKNHSSGRCPSAGSIAADVIEDYVTERFFAALGPDGILAARVPDTAALESARDDVEAAEGERSAWVEMFSVAELGRDAFLDGLRARESRLEAARAAEAALAPDAATALPEALSLADTWPTLSPEERRRILAAAVGAVFLRPGRSLPLEERVRICWAGEEPDDLPRRGVARAFPPFEW